MARSEPVIPRKSPASSAFRAGHSAKLVRVALMARSEPVVPRNSFLWRSACIAPNARPALVAFYARAPMFTPRVVLVHTVCAALGAAGVTSNAGINTNILSFTQCLAALRNNTVPPWRDCILTKILKGLITTNTTTILGCVNFDYHHEAMNTIRVVGDAARGMCDGAPTAATTLPIIDPLNGDLLDPTPSNRRMVTIPCKTGDIVARVMGDESDPLILYVHG